MAWLLSREFSMATAEYEETLSLQGQHSNTFAQNWAASFRSFGLYMLPPLGTACC